MIQDFAGHKVLFTMAAPAEYGPALRARITPLMTGIGPVEAAITTARALASAPDLPDLVVCLGSAGSQRLTQGSIVQLASVQYRDMDATALGFAKGETPLSELPIEIPLPQVTGLPSARAATGASVVSGDAYDGIDADLVEMESFAVLRACQMFDLPMWGLRGISDGAAPLEGMHSWTELLPLLDARLAEALDHLARALENGEIVTRR